jgi:diguanylate cyclase (GGDEF)-like protein
MARPPTTRLAAFLSTRFGRRIFGVFVACGLVPIAILAALSWARVSAELRNQSERRLHTASRSIGMAAMGALLEAAQRLEHADDAEVLGDWIAGVAESTPGGGWRPVVGAAVPAPQLDAADRERLATGGTLLRSAGADGRRVLVLVESGPSGAPRAARIDGAGLFGGAAQNVLTADAELCVLDADRTPLYCPLSALAAVPSRPGGGKGEGAEIVGRGEGEYLAVPWPLFLRASFGHPGLTVVVGESTDAVYAPIARFRVDLALVTLLSLALATFVSIRQIRRRLLPLERLGAGTRRVAESDFSVRVEVESDDELGELATSFNAMARRLEGQFQSLERVIEIDRGILGARDEAGLAASFLEPVQRLHAFPASLVAVLDADDQRFRVHAHGAAQVREAEGLSPPEREELRRLPMGARLPAEALPARCRSLLPEPVGPALLVPLIAGGELLGLFLAGLASGDGLARENELYVRQLCDQLAAALRGQRLRAQNERLQNFDPLTGLPNRRWLDDSLSAALRSDGGRLVAVARVTVEGLDRVRATFGPEEVDRIVRALGVRLREERRAVVSHLEGGEFALLAEGEDAEAVSRELRHVLAIARDALEDDERGHALQLRAGVSVAPLDCEDAETLLRNADAALRHATERTETGLVFFAARMNQALAERVRLESDLARATERGELRVYYQPIVDATTLEIVGAEALVRWQHPELGLVPPGRFVGLAEEAGFIGSIGRFVLRTACRNIRAWLDAGLPAPRISVNVSAHQLEGLLSEVLGALGAARVPPALLSLELTESAFMGEDLATVETFRAIHRAGVALSMDDFGTGYSSLSYLKLFPLDTLKLDKIFVQGVTREADKRAITEAVLAMARELGLRVVAEGVETEDQLRFLRERGCALLQGYLFAAPMPEDAFRKLLAERAAGDGFGEGGGRYTPAP